MAEAAARGATGDLALALFERHQREVYAYLCRMVHDPQWAEDLAQETFVRALRARRQLAQVENQRAWLYRIATNLALNALKRRRRFAWLPWRAADDLPVSKGDPADWLGGRQAVEAALEALPPELRAPAPLRSLWPEPGGGGRGAEPEPGDGQDAALPGAHPLPAGVQEG